MGNYIKAMNTIHDNNPIVDVEEKCESCGNTDLMVAKYKNGAKWLECEKCNSAVKPLNKIAREN